MAKTRRISRTARQKLEIVKFAEQNSNVAASKKFICPESSIRLWRKNKNVLTKMPANKMAMRYRSCHFSELEKELKNWVLKQRDLGLGVSTFRLRLQAKNLTQNDQRYAGFQGINLFPLFKLSNIIFK